MVGVAVSPSLAEVQDRDVLFCSICLHALYVDVPADQIRKSSEIKEITVNGLEIKISQYADGTALILDGSKESLAAYLKF